MKKNAWRISPFLSNCRGIVFSEFMVALTVVFLIGLVSYPFVVRYREREHLSSCQYNLRAIGSALEIFGDDNQRRDGGSAYPAQFSQIFDGEKPYLKPEPLCPSNKSRYGYEVDSSASVFTVFCRGRHRRSGEPVEEGYPQYSQNLGLIVQ